MTPWTTLLNGRVRKTSLVTIHGRPPPDAPRLRRLLLDQGELAHFWDGEFPINYMALLELRQGTTRGNHYHKIKREFLYVMSGHLNVLLEDIASRDKAAVDLKTGDLVDIQPAVAHAYIVKIPGQALEFSEAKFNATDTFSFNLS